MSSFCKHSKVSLTCDFIMHLETLQNRFHFRAHTNLSILEESSHSIGKYSLPQIQMLQSKLMQLIFTLRFFRHQYSQPIFLHRNLSYMKGRMSRKQSRKEFRVDSLLSIVTNRNRIEAEKNACPNNYLTVMFLGIYDKSMPSEQAAEVSIILSKISHLKRKDSFTKKQNLVSTNHRAIK